MLSVHSKLGEDFQKIIDAWNEYCDDEEKRRQIQLIVDVQNFVMFFVFNDEVFGATEPNRVMFAKMKSPGEEESSVDWIQDASFMATNLTKTVSGQPAQSMFKHKDIDNIEVLPDKEQVLDILCKQSESLPMSLTAQERLQSVIKLIKSRQ